MKIYNLSSFKNQRLLRAYLAGISSAIVLSIVIAIFLTLTHIYISLIFYGAAYLITMAIRKYGRGVRKSFSICGLISVLLLIILTDLLYYSSFNPANLFIASRYILSTYANLNINSLITIAIKAYSVYYGYIYARIV